ncbi:GD19353 [Drosophila simulans]|uniref:GD19353 n=1 Tax=Drosophila simulans TaxID=7240 RepID=B4QS34_DROSI|nr:GD19353 [Drosophila simulans]
MALAADAPALVASCSGKSTVNCDKIHRNLITTGPIRRRMGWRNCISIPKHVSCQIMAMAQLNRQFWLPAQRTATRTRNTEYRIRMRNGLRVTGYFDGHGFTGVPATEAGTGSGPSEMEVSVYCPWHAVNSQLAVAFAALPQVQTAWEAVTPLMPHSLSLSISHTNTHFCTF